MSVIPYYAHTAESPDGTRLAECHWQLLAVHPNTGSSPALRFPLRLDRGEGRVRCRFLPILSVVRGILESVLRWGSLCCLKTFPQEAAHAR
jgi:hypothetical protein